MIYYVYMKNISIKKNSQGFTVLEFLIVVLIMTILIGIAMVGFGNARQRSRDDMRIAGMHNVMLSLQQYYSACRSYPATLEWDDEQSCRQGSDRALSDFGTKPPLPPGESFMYRAFAEAESAIISMSICSFYHLGVRLEDENHMILTESSNANSAGTSITIPSLPDFPPPFPCVGSSSGFDGTIPGTYDIFR